MKRTVGEKGQVTIPKALRDSMAIRPGTQLDFKEEGGKLIIGRAAERGSLQSLRGILPRMNVAAAIRELRGPDWSPKSDEKRRGHRRR